MTFSCLLRIHMQTVFTLLMIIIECMHFMFMNFEQLVFLLSCYSFIILVIGNFLSLFKVSLVCLVVIFGLKEVFSSSISIHPRDKQHLMLPHTFHTCEQYKMLLKG